MTIRRLLLNWIRRRFGLLPPDWIDYHFEKIRCPGCEQIVRAQVGHTIFWNDYTHICKCGYQITESEWEQVT